MFAAPFQKQCQLLRRVHRSELWTVSTFYQVNSPYEDFPRWVVWIIKTNRDTLVDRQVSLDFLKCSFSMLWTPERKSYWPTWWRQKSQSIDLKASADKHMLTPVFWTICMAGHHTEVSLLLLIIHKPHCGQFLYGLFLYFWSEMLLWKCYFSI